MQKLMRGGYTIKRKFKYVGYAIKNSNTVVWAISSSSINSVLTITKCANKDKNSKLNFYSINEGNNLSIEAGICERISRS